MNKLLITGCLLATAFAAVAMPTKKELAAAQKLVEDVIAPDVKALNAGRKTVKDVADVQMKLAADAQSEAEKYLLLQSAFKLYSRGEEFDSAAKALAAIVRDIKDVPPELITELVDKEFNRDMGLRAPKEIEAAVSRIADSGAKVINGKATVDGYTWSYRVKNGEATIVAEKDGKFSCAVSPTPTGSISIPSALNGTKVTSIGNEAFRDCKGLEAVMFPPSITNIGVLAFYSCDIKSVNIPASVTSIGTQAFSDNGELMSFSVEESNPSYSSRKGLLCSKDGSTLISGTSGDVEIPFGVTSIEGWAFTGRRKLTSVTIPPSVTNIGRTVFRWCSGLKSITIPPAVTRLDSNVFRDCSGLTSVVIPSNVTTIGWCAFCQCGGLTEVTIPASVTRIDGCAFWSCSSLVSVTIPASVMSIGERAFNQCGSLISVTMCGECPTASKAIFQGCPKLKSIHVPANSKSWSGMTEWQGIPLVFDGTDGSAGSSPTVHAAVESILKGMIKVPGRDYWLSATEVTQEQWEPIMEYNLSEHKGAKLPVECVSRDDCDVFLEKLNQTKEVLSSGFEFRLPELEEWKYAAWAGSAGNGSWIKPGIVGDVLDMAWVRENSSNEMHAVATKIANAFGFYDMLGNVWEWLAGDAPKGRGALKGCAFSQVADKCTWNQNLYLSKVQRVPLCGLRLAAHKKDFLWQPLSGGLRRPGSASDRSQVGQKTVLRQETVNGYTWSYRVNNGEAEIVSEKDGKFLCAVSPSPNGDVVIPETLGGVAVTRVGQCAFKDCKGMTSVKIPSTVKSFGSWGVFAGCSGLTSVAIPNGVKCIEECAFWGCSSLKSVTIPPSVTKISDAAFGCCGGLTSMTIPPTVKELKTQVFFGCGALKSVTIPASVEKIGWAAFVYSGELKEINVDPKNKWFTSVGGALYTKDLTELVACPNALTSFTIHPSVKKLRAAAIISCGKLESLTIPEGVTDIGWQAIKDCGSLKTVTIPSTVRSIAEIAFCNCRGLTSVTIPAGVTSIGKRAFENCGALTLVTMGGERPNSPGDIFPNCAKLKEIHVPANAKSWAGMKEWQGIPLVFDGQ